MHPTVRHASSDDIVLTFRDAGDLPALAAATCWLDARGFAIGEAEEGCPAGIRLGKDAVAQWRSLGSAERKALDGELRCDGRNGTATVSIYRRASSAVRAIAAAADQASRQRPAGTGIPTGRLALLTLAVLLLVPTLFAIVQSYEASSRRTAVGKLTLRVLAPEPIESRPPLRGSLP